MLFFSLAITDAFRLAITGDCDYNRLNICILVCWNNFIELLCIFIYLMH